MGRVLLIGRLGAHDLRHRPVQAVLPPRLAGGPPGDRARLQALARAPGVTGRTGDLQRARELLPCLCGRDPQGLDFAGIARAVVESVAENTSDAIVAPLIWGALAGLSGYRAVNTLDAMVGHRSPRYERFGRASARLDDVANWIPALATALLAAACSAAVRGRPWPTWQTARDWGAHHPSPNAGWCEAAFAGALGVRLGGTLSYSGRTEHRPEIGTGRAPQAGDIARAIRLSRAVTASATALAAAVAVGSSAIADAHPRPLQRLEPVTAGMSTSVACAGSAVATSP